MRSFFRNFFTWWLMIIQDKIMNDSRTSTISHTKSLHPYSAFKYVAPYKEDSSKLLEGSNQLSGY